MVLSLYMCGLFISETRIYWEVITHCHCFPPFELLLIGIVSAMGAHSDSSDRSSSRHSHHRSELDLSIICRHKTQVDR